MINTCNGNTFTTNSGKTFDFSNPSVDVIDIRDIAHALSNICRWGGHGPFFSVGEHSVLASELAMQDRPNNYELQMAVLLHDATEAYIGDMPKPLKIMIAQYNGIEERLEALISNKFIPYSYKYSKDDIKYYDLQMFKKERDELFSVHTGPDLDTIPYPDIDLEMWTPSEAKIYFLERYYSLKDKCKDGYFKRRMAHWSYKALC